MLLLHPAPRSTALAMADTHLSSSPVYPTLNVLLQTRQSIEGFWSLGFPTNAKNGLFKGIQAGFSSAHSKKGSSQGSAVRQTHEFHFLYDSLRASHSLHNIPSL